MFGGNLATDEVSGQFSSIDEVSVSIAFCRNNNNNANIGMWSNRG